MNKIKTKKTYIILIIIIILCIILLFIRIGNNNSHTPDYNLTDFYTQPNKERGVNEYFVSTISDEDMAKIYFNTYIMLMLEEPDNAYSKLNENYKNVKYPTIASFREYLFKITKNLENIPTIAKYYVKKEKDKSIYYTEDTNGNKYIFVAFGTMKYTVYLDDDTIKIE